MPSTIEYLYDLSEEALIEENWKNVVLLNEQLLDFQKHRREDPEDSQARLFEVEQTAAQLAQIRQAFLKKVTPAAERAELAREEGWCDHEVGVCNA